MRGTGPVYRAVDNAFVLNVLNVRCTRCQLFLLLLSPPFRPFLVACTRHHTRLCFVDLRFADGWLLGREYCIREVIIYKLHLLCQIYRQTMSMSSHPSPRISHHHAYHTDSEYTVATRASNRFISARKYSRRRCIFHVA